MAKRSRMTMLKRQRELRKAEKARRKRALKHGRFEEELVEPRPTWQAEASESEQDVGEDPPEEEVQ